jgi:hypothetical protein
MGLVEHEMLAIIEGRLTAYQEDLKSLRRALATCDFGAEGYERLGQWLCEQHCGLHEFLGVDEANRFSMLTDQYKDVAKLDGSAEHTA